ncbi:hypothetical protein [Pseudomonas syringae]|uniref:hypothetical protein n=1 Tax=Pseudomonas syringae TaxID=317 RepID=UPI00028DB043|nr:hypothetical protein [Pseudomonas syringae]EKG41281.1 hypothetical protein Pav037_0341 [Pseudomonas syringae pv. avellanae str. ISPaVe037]MCF8984377.1 hypothetical protein [Pseudomonas syringae]
MATEFLKNGNFSDGLKYWAAPEDFDPDFKPWPAGDGQSIKLDATEVTVSQFINELPDSTLRIEFDVHRADVKIDEALFVIAVGGYNKEGALNLTPIIGLATEEWEHFSGEITFEEALEKCFVNLSAPSNTFRFSLSNSNSRLASQYGPVRFANLSLSTIDAKDADQTD